VTQENKHIIRQKFSLGKEERRKQLNQHSLVLWFTGLSGSGKSTLVNEVAQQLANDGFHNYTLDGDNIRLGLNKDLGFSVADRTENIRRIGEVAKLFVDAGIIVLTSFISPLRKDRETVRSLVEDDEFVEIFVNCPLEVCEQRDTKGLYAKARRGEIKDFTGIDSPFEQPEHPEIEIRTDQLSIQEAKKEILAHIYSKIALTNE
jgi:adenylylsulfate kinase